jgi:hypothetical protein
MGRDAWKWELGALVGLSLLVRGIASLREQLLFGDAPYFISIARAFGAGHWEAALAQDHHPLTSLLMAAVAALSAVDLETAGRVVSVASGGIAVGALYLFARSAFDRTTALVAGLLLAGHPRTVAVSSSVQSDGLYLALFLLGVLGTWRALERGRSLPALGAAIACGLAYLTRPEGLAVGLVFLGWLWADWLRGRVATGAAARLSAVFLAPALALVAAYVIGMQQVGGSWMLSGKKSALALIQIDSAIASPTVLLEVLRGVTWDGVRAAHPALLVFALLGLARGRPERATLFVLSFAGLFLALLVGVYLEAGYISRRHWLGPVALIFPLAARGALDLGRLLGRHVRSPGLQSAGRLGFVALLVAFALGRVLLAREDPGKLATKHAGLWLRDSAPGSVVAARRLRTAYYATAERFVDIHSRLTPRRTIEELRAEGVEYLVLDATLWRRYRVGPQEAVREVHRVEHPDGSVLVLRLEAGPPPGDGRSTSR